MKKIFLFIALIIVVYSASAQSDPNEIDKNQNLQSAIEHLGGTNTFVSFNPKDDVRGSRYLNNGWVKGTVTDTSNTVFNNEDAGYNYDKITHNLYMTADKKNVVMLDGDKVKSFALNNMFGMTDTYKRIPSVDASAFFKVVAEGNGPYSVYELTKTTFEKANYRTDGMVESGKNYDEYVDNKEYYIGFNNGASYKKAEPKRKSLNKLFADDAKAQAFLKAHSSDDVNISFLKELIIYLNGN